MSITVKFFASLRDRIGREGDVVDAEKVSTVEDVWIQVAPQLDAPDNLLVAVNMEYADMGYKVKDGDEIAFFPPVTGG